MKKFIILIACLCWGFNVFAQYAEKFKDANALYNQGKYAEAIDIYESILDKGMHSSELYFNLGNANYKLNNIAPSIYYYEKSLLLNPNDKEVKNNLAFAQNMTIDDIEQVPEVGLSKLFKNIVNRASVNTWAYISVSGVFLFVILFLTYHFSQATSNKRSAFIVSLLAIIVSIVTFFMALKKDEFERNYQPAIVFAEEIKVKTEPNQRSEESLRLHEGTKVQVIDTLNNWKKIKLANGSTGWVIASDIKNIKDF